LGLFTLTHWINATYGDLRFAQNLCSSYTGGGKVFGSKNDVVLERRLDIGVIATGTD